MPETVSCILCDVPPEPRPAFTRYALLPPPFEIARCPRCGLVYQSPRPTPAELAERYMTHPYYAADNADRGAGRIAFYERRMTRLARRLPERARLLGIGCLEGGHALRAAADRGWEVVAVESSPILAAHARERLGLTVEQRPAWDLSTFDGGPFDAIYSHGFEHLSNPLATLAECRRLLADGGVLLLEVPNQFRSLKELLKRGVFAAGPATAERWLELETDELNLFHTYYFSPRTLRRVVDAAGFATESVRTYLPDHPVYLGGGWKRPLQELLHAVGGAVGRGPSIELLASPAR